MNMGLGVGALAPGIVAAAIRKNVTQMAKMFITGESPEEALPVIKKARLKSISFTADLLGEATLSGEEAFEYQSRYMDLIRKLSSDSDSWTRNAQIDTDSLGEIPKVNISVKLTSLYSQISHKAWDESINKLKERIRPILALAMERNVFVNIDMEQYSHKDLTLQVFKELMMEPNFKTYPYFGIVIQAYLRDSFEDVRGLIDFAKARGTRFSVRLVKGAYWDYETIHAQQMAWPVPVYTHKKESDWNFERCAWELLQGYPHILLAAASHNVRSIAATVVMAEKLKLPPNSYELQMLYGMAEPIKNSLVKQGARVREYATIGELIPGMAYLVRRLLENTSNESFLRSKFAENIPVESLLRNPAEGLNASSRFMPVAEGSFQNEALLDFTLSENREKMQKSIQTFLNNKKSNIYPLIINGKSVKTKTIHKRENPSNKEDIVGQVYMASIEDAEHAIEGATKSFQIWKNTPVEKRIEVLTKLAHLMRRDRFSLMATEIFETGKPWSEADGDVAEAIDFCEYYAKDMARIGKPERVSFVSGESSHYIYKPRGVCAVIAPWNFPLAIVTGMVVSGIVTGNTVIMKPAEQSSIIGAQLMALLMEAGCPPGVVQFLPGYGEDIGRYLVNHKNVSIISFTGSRSVGLEILNATTKLSPGQRHIKKAVIEMGGKNAIILDSDADLDEAVVGVLYSAFGYSGQKCSACSRVIVLDSIYDRFIQRLVDAAKSFYVRKADDPHAYMGPVIDQEAYERIKNTITESERDSKKIFSGEVPAGGYFVPPTIFSEVAPNSKLAQEEIFGPVLAVIRAKDFNEALLIANDSQYALTGGLFSRSPANIERAKNELEVGNLYINRGITGALVGRHPFGGYKLSGLGSKTGGKDYLIQFMEPTVTTENTLRRGFAPAEED
jgi:RHH-type proline utilization regulon transcriptional repressor/proline dehydrogenase/delta 1-pyrroline-5-carboxylate dehydrogenase